MSRTARRYGPATFPAIEALAVTMKLAALSTKIRTEFPLSRQARTPHPKPAAVLVPLFDREGLVHVLMIRRALHLNAHAGEIAFPGGGPEAEDADLLATALRETEEEVGCRIDPAAVIGCLKPVTTRTGFRVWPYVAALPTGLSARANSEEVLEILCIPLVPLFRTYEPDSRFDKAAAMPVYHFDGHRIWGASARALRQLDSLIRPI
ncbi:MAG: CoA pyrophosphatase [Nitrospinaceae bacterium]|nr:MAG: CoA pyrophosphatase [Nitrospinaceae bacterium]